MTSARIELIHELVSAAAAAEPDRHAVIASDGSASTFTEFDGQVGSVAAWVDARTRRGDRVAVIADNGSSYARLYYGVPRSGRILVLINQRLSPGEQLAQLASAEPAVLLGDARYLTALAERVRTIPILQHVCAFEDPQWQRAERDSVAFTGRVDPDEPAWLLFTSGSTGTPKGVLHTHRSITTAVRGTVAGRSVRSGGVYLLPFPMCHVAGYNMLVHHSVQSTVLPVAAFRPDAFVATVNRHGVTSCSLAPTMLHALLAYLEETGLELPSLRDIAYGSAAIPADLLRRALSRLDVAFHQGYGMTETGGNVCFLGPDEHRAGAGDDPSILATAGTPHDEVEVRISPEDADGGIGEILVRGAQVAAAYWRSGTPTTVDGWLPTGDVGRIDDMGRLTVLDRLKDVIITGGENVSSREVEDVLSSHPDVDQVAVVGVPDEYWGEAICAVIVALPGRRPSAGAIATHVRDRIAGFKRPRHVLFVDALPLTSNGKVAKNAVREYARTQVPPA
ncbi:AMP-binding protein [Mycolicibacterium sp.]|uniref:AMP-binding protein n=1 Tax=Mycolicibacterium sp. TaxID=2320850 RepID=UPI001A2B638B|nr:AMP-binding protein [Mycolicibacterium sp.]MBJ7336141.1 AMP-binding protein [Mycolicibacterium sp.]